MTEKSYFWNHGTGGDATYSPYDSDEFNLFHFMPAIVEEKTNAYVIPDYLNSLWVRSAGEGTHAVSIGAGAACFYNYLYVSDSASTKNISRATAGTARIDLIVLRFSFTAGKPTIRLAIVEGGEAVYPTEPSLTQLANTWEVALASIYVSGDDTYIDDKYIIDKRRFIYTDYVREKYGTPDNLLRNSEWFSIFESYSPSAWGEYATNYDAGGYTSNTLGSGRGNIAIDTATGVGGICQWVRGGKSKVYTARGNLENVVDGYSVGIRGFRENGVESSISKQITFMSCPAASSCTTDIEYQFTIEFPENDIQDILFYFRSIDESAGTSAANIGQAILVPGYFPGNYHKEFETILLSTEVDDTNWNNTAKSTGTTTIDFSTDFLGIGTAKAVPEYTKFVIILLRAQDSGSAAGAPYVRLLGYTAPYNVNYGTVRLGGVTNDSWKTIQAIVPANQIYWKTGVAGGQLRIEVSATGVGTTDVYAEVVGVIV